MFFFLRNRAMLVVGCLLMPAFATGQTLNDDQWKNVMQAQKGPEFLYAVQTRDLGCAEGTVLSVSDQSLIVKLKDGARVTIPKPEVLQLRYLNSSPGSILYSQRSSWLDVTQVWHGGEHYGHLILVVMRDGAKHKGRLLETQDSNLTLTEGPKSPEKQVRIAKAEVSEVYRVTFKRMTAGAEYIYQELTFFWVFDPAVWPALVDRGTLVLLYRAGNKEENEPLICSHEL